MKYKVGDRVRIKDDISVSKYSVSKMYEWQGTVMTVRDARITSNGSEYYKMEQDSEDWNWWEDMIEGLAESELTNTEILKLAISTYGEDEQIRMCHEEMDELGVALSKYHRNPCEETLANVQEEIADVCVMMQQAKLMFGEKEVDAVIQQKIKRLNDDLEGEQEVDIVLVLHDLKG